MRHGAILGAVVGVALFAMFYWMGGGVGSMLIIPFAAVMGFAMQYVKVEEE
ncbi:MAG: hypothetical protein LBS92_04175 [Candidatus Methanoplasma sp.]|jgi:hypothetical protein|nr:hypothetical protein [Candidatus Methanoplasma sp.]